MYRVSKDNFRISHLNRFEMYLSMTTNINEIEREVENISKLLTIHSSKNLKHKNMVAYHTVHA